MDSIPETDEDRSDGNLELFTVSLVATLAIAVTLLVAVSWKHLRAKAIAPADAPILVE